MRAFSDFTKDRERGRRGKWRKVVGGVASEWRAGQLAVNKFSRAPYLTSSSFPVCVPSSPDGVLKKLTSPRPGVRSERLAGPVAQSAGAIRFAPATTRVMCVEGRRTAAGRSCTTTTISRGRRRRGARTFPNSRAAISRLRMYFRFDNSILEPPPRALAARSRAEK